MNTWYDYRTVWSAHAWVLAVGILGAAMIVAGVVGTFTRTPAVFLFIPGLAVLYGHHLIVRRQLG